MLQLHIAKMINSANKKAKYSIASDVSSLLTGLPKAATFESGYTYVTVKSGSYVCYKILQLKSTMQKVVQKIAIFLLKAFRFQAELGFSMSCFRVRKFAAHESLPWCLWVVVAESEMFEFIYIINN